MMRLWATAKPTCLFLIVDLSVFFVYTAGARIKLGAIKEENVSYIGLSVSSSERMVLDGDSVKDFGRSIVEFGRRFGHDIRLVAARPDPELIRGAEILIVVTESCSAELMAELEIAQDAGTPTIVCLAARHLAPQYLREIPVLVEIYRWSVLASAHDYVRAVIAQYRSPFRELAIAPPEDGESDREYYWVGVAPSVH